MICQRHLRVLDPAGNGQADTAGTCSTDPESGGSAPETAPCGWQARPRRMVSSRGISTSGVTSKRHAVKLPLPQHIGQRLPVQQPPDGDSSCPGRSCSDAYRLPVCQNGFRTFPGHMAQQLPRHHRPPSAASSVSSSACRASRYRSDRTCFTIDQHPPAPAAPACHRRNAHLNHGVVRLVGGKMLQPHARAQ